jgi:sigma-E factor negative regulatory protein RseA
MTRCMKLMQSASEGQVADGAAVQRAQLSALADGQLQGVDFADALALFDDAHAGGQARAGWHTLHVVGDVLRSSEFAACRKDVDFFARLTTALQLEPSLASSAHATSVPRQLTDIEATPLEPRQAAVVKDSANEPVFHWKWMTGLTSVAAVLAISWNLVGGLAVNPAAPLAQITLPAPALVAVQVAAPAQSGSDVMLRSPQLDAMMAAHSQLGGSSALQMPSGFLRNATFNATFQATPSTASNGVAR